MCSTSFVGGNVSERSVPDDGMARHDVSLVRMLGTSASGAGWGDRVSYADNGRQINPAVPQPDLRAGLCVSR
jgi:hypothetical protein